MHLWTVPITIVEALVLEMPLGTLQFFVHYTCMGSGSTWIARVCAFLGEYFDSNLCDCVTLGHSLLLVFITGILTSCCVVIVMYYRYHKLNYPVPKVEYHNNST